MTAAMDEQTPAEMWEGLTADELRETWKVPAVHLFTSVGSTNDVARDLAARGAQEGTVVLAEEQRKGRGRVGRTWTSPPGLGLWISAVARPRPEHLEALPIRVGLAIALVLDQWTGDDETKVKWPNDLMIDDRKVGGILCEASWAGSKLDHAVIGVGLNLLHRDDDFPADIRASAVSLAGHSEDPISRFAVASAVVGALVDVLENPALSEELLGSLAERDALVGRNIEVLEPESGSRLATGFATGIDRDGRLLLNGPWGNVSIRSGTVRVIGGPA